MPLTSTVQPWPVADELTITDPAAVELLWHPPKRLHLRPFLGRAAGLAEAAQLLGIKKPAMGYWVARLLEVGLIRRWPAQGRTPRYRCIADRLVVSLCDAPLQSYEAVFDDIASGWQGAARQALGRALALQAPQLALRIDASRPGGLATLIQPAAPEAARDDFIYYWGRLWLTVGERQALRAELDALWEKHAALSDRAAKKCSVLVHMVAVAEEAR
jgi:hypothetical protein